MYSRCNITDKIVALGEVWEFDLSHAFQVNRLALQLFDQLQSLHHMGATERLWLMHAAYLHDIGKSLGAKDHHKRAQEIILKDSTLALDRKARVVVSLIARYHRGEAPQAHHPVYCKLSFETRAYVLKLAALLRLADGLDRGGQDVVEAVRCSHDSQQVGLEIQSPQSLSLAKLRRKSKLFEGVYQRFLFPWIHSTQMCNNFPLDSDSPVPYAECL